jgi:hypothetical protein
MLQIMFDQATNTLFTSKTSSHVLLQASKFHQIDSLQTA